MNIATIAAPAPRAFNGFLPPAFERPARDAANFAGAAVNEVRNLNPRLLWNSPHNFGIRQRASNLLSTSMNLANQALFNANFGVPPRNRDLIMRGMDALNAVVRELNVPVLNNSAIGRIQAMAFDGYRNLDAASRRF